MRDPGRCNGSLGWCSRTWWPRARAGRWLARRRPWRARWSGGVGTGRKADALNRGDSTMMTMAWPRRCGRGTAASAGARTAGAADVPVVRRTHDVGTTWRRGGTWHAGFNASWGTEPGEGCSSIGTQPREGTVARTSRRRGASGRARRRGAAGSSSFCWVPVWARITPRFGMEVHQTMNRKVVDLTILYNFHKGHMVLFSTGFAEKACQLWMSICVSEQEVLSDDQAFHPFLLKIGNANLHESYVPQQTGQLSYW
jgi:hypothetical protein